MRLIDADALIEISTANDIYGMVEISDIEQMPTAYDVDKVVEQLEEAKSLTNDLMSIARNYAIDRAIEIVKAGAEEGEEEC